MEIQFKLNIGGMEITITEQAENQAEFVEKVAFFSTLPNKGPNGEDDLKLVHRVTSKGHNYYSIISEQAQKEYKLGQSQREPGKLFGKGWEDLYNPENANNGVSNQADPFAQAAQQQPVQQQQQPAQQQQASYDPFAQAAQQQPVQQQPVQQADPFAQQLAQPQQQTPPSNNTPAANNQVVNDVLSQFNIT